MATDTTGVERAPREHAAGRTEAVPLRARTWQREGLVAAAFLAPSAIVLLVLRLYPTVEALIASAQRQPLNILAAPVFVGLDNYRTLLVESPTFWPSVAATVIFVTIVVVAQTVGALALGLLYTQHMYATRWWRALVFLPITIPMAVSTLVWQIAFRNDGVVNGFLSALGLGQYNYFATRGLAYFAFLTILSWIGLGYWMALLIAGLADVPTEVRDAAKVDGAGAIRTFFSIVLPLLKRPLAFVAVALTVTNFFTFIPEAVITQGGPRDATRFLMFEIYTEAYSNGNTNRASAEIVLLAIIILAIVAVEFKLIAPED